MFLFARVFGLFYYYFAVFRKGVFFIEKCHFIDIWHACPEKNKNCQYLIKMYFLFFVRTIHYC